jgi:ABC-2 type transport system permease protein
MRFFSVFMKFLRENLRDWGILLLALALAPFFVLIFHLAFDSQPSTYSMVIINKDTGRDSRHCGADLAGLFKDMKWGDGAVSIKAEIMDETGADAAVEKIKKGQTDIALVIPRDFSQQVFGKGKPVIDFYGDMASAKYVILVAVVYSVVEQYIAGVSGKQGLFGINEVSVRPPSRMNAFDSAIPSLLILSLLTVLFTAAATFVRESEKGTLRRLQLSRLTALEYLSAAGLIQIIISILCMFLTLLTAVAFGYKTGPWLGPVMVIGGFTSFSIIAFSLITAGFCSSVKDVMIIGNFPYFFLLIFSGIMPLPSASLFTLLGHPFTFSNFFPVSFGVQAMNKVMNYGLGMKDIGFELAAILLLSLVYFLAGLLLFNRKHMRTA